MFNIDQSRIAQILGILETNNANNSKCRVLNDAEQSAVITLCLAGNRTQQEIADVVGLDQGNISRIMQNGNFSEMHNSIEESGKSISEVAQYHNSQ